MPASTQSLLKKRRRDEEEDIHFEFSHGYYNHQQQQHQQQHHTSPPRKIVPYSSPLSKKIRINAPCDDHQTHQPRQTLQPLARAPGSKPHSPPKPTINLSPCHICSRKPTKKTDLDSYADCEGCGERTCFVCIRQCLGERKCTPTGLATYAESHHADVMRDDIDSDEHHDRTEHDEDEESRTPRGMERSFSMEDAPCADEDHGARLDRTKRGGTWGRGEGRGHRGRICSQCCVELGTQGEVKCLGCLET